MTSFAEKKLVDFVRNLETLQDNNRYGNLKNRVVADLGVNDPELYTVLLDAGVSHLLVTGSSHIDLENERITEIAGNPLKVSIPPFDVGFFDARRYNGFDHVRGVNQLVEVMHKSLKPGGIVFAMLKSGSVLPEFDVYNSIVHFGAETLPSNDYLFRELLADCTIRVLGYSPTSRQGEIVRLLRLGIKLPTLLLILGRSHSGKTSLALDLLRLNDAMHVSHDYIYSELVIRIRQGLGDQLPDRLVTLAGDGSGYACELFNRSLETDPELLCDYMKWIIPLIPPNKRLVSMDFDLVTESQVELAKKVLSDSGFSVWVVRR